MRMEKYFVCYSAEDNEGKPSSGIYKFKFNPLENNVTIRKAEKQILKSDFGDKRDLTIINIFKIV